MNITSGIGTRHHIRRLDYNAQATRYAKLTISAKIFDDEKKETQYQSDPVGRSDVGRFIVSLGDWIVENA